MEITFWVAIAAVVYVGIGARVTTITLSQTPYGKYPWWMTTAAWPVFLFLSAPGGAG